MRKGVNGMECKHHIVKCVNCVKYCQICGARLDAPAPVEAATEAKAAATERPKRKAAKKGATKE